MENIPGKEAQMVENFMVYMSKNYGIMWKNHCKIMVNIKVWYNMENHSKQHDQI